MTWSCQPGQPGGWSCPRRGQVLVLDGMAGRVVMHHVPVTLGAAWWVGLGLGLGLGVAWCWTGLGAAGHWWVARCCWSGCVFAVAPPLTCMFACSLTFGVSIGGGGGDFFLVVFGLVGGCFGGVQALCLVGCVSDRSPGALPWFSFRAHTAPGRQEPATPPRSGRETGPGSRSLPGLSAGGDPPGSGCHSYPGPRS